MVLLLNLILLLTLIYGIQIMRLLTLSVRVYHLFLLGYTTTLRKIMLVINLAIIKLPVIETHDVLSVLNVLVDDL